ncbi:winged helix DNA-binding domain-containing protein, partial [Listeria monocytogenes]
MQIPADKNYFSRDEAFKDLALRYFLSHAPATLYVFCFWSGLSVTDANIGLADMPIMGDFYISSLARNDAVSSSIPLAGFE